MIGEGTISTSFICTQNRPQKSGYPNPLQQQTIQDSGWLPMRSVGVAESSLCLIAWITMPDMPLGRERLRTDVEMPRVLRQTGASWFLRPDFQSSNQASCVTRLMRDFSWQTMSQTNPVNSRAIATQTTFWFLPSAISFRYRPHSRFCAFHAMAWA